MAPEPNPSPLDAGPSDGLAEQLDAQLAGEQGVQVVEAVEVAGGTPGEAQGVDAQPQPLSGEVLVDLGGGVLKTVPVADLIAAYSTQGEIDRDRAAVTAREERLSAATVLQQAVASLPDAAQQVVLRMISNPELIGQMNHQQPAATPDPLDQAMGAQPNGHQPAQQNQANGFEARFARLEQLVGSLANHVSGQVTQQRNDALAEQVTAEIGRYESFKSDPVAAAMAQRAVLAEARANPDLNVASACAEAAAVMQQKLLERTQRARGAQNGAPTTGGQNGVIDLPDLDDAPTAARMNDGSLLGDLQRLMAGSVAQQ